MLLAHTGMHILLQVGYLHASIIIIGQCSAAISINCGEGTVAVPQGNRTLAMKIVTAINCTEIFEGCECATNSTLPACNSQDNGFVYVHILIVIITCCAYYFLHACSVRVQFGDGTQYFQQYEQPPQFELVYTYQNTGTYSVCIKIRHVKTQGGVRVCLTVNVV